MPESGAVNATTPLPGRVAAMWLPLHAAHIDPDQWRVNAACFKDFSLQNSPASSRTRPERQLAVSFVPVMISEWPRCRLLGIAQRRPAEVGRPYRSMSAGVAAAIQKTLIATARPSGHYRNFIKHCFPPKSLNAYFGEPTRQTTGGYNVSNSITPGSNSGASSLKSIAGYALAASAPIALLNPIVGGTGLIIAGATYVAAGWIDGNDTNENKGD
jgi:hypothetical protein